MVGVGRVPRDLHSRTRAARTSGYPVRSSLPLVISGRVCSVMLERMKGVVTARVPGAGRALSGTLAAPLHGHRGLAIPYFIFSVKTVFPLSSLISAARTASTKLCLDGTLRFVVITIYQVFDNEVLEPEGL